MLSDLSNIALFVVFAIAATAVISASIKATGLADIIADRTQIGEAIAGGILLGGATSLAGIVVSVNAALSGDASLAFSNAVGGIAAQTLFLVLADLIYRNVNIEHAAAEPVSLLQAIFLIMMLALPLSAIAGPEFSVLGVHPASILLFLVYLYSVRKGSEMSKDPLWTPVETSDTRLDEPEDEDEANKPVGGPATRFALLVVVIGLGGYAISQVGAELIVRFGLSSSLVGALITAVVTSMPEMVTTLTAVRRGALQLAIGGIIGGNTFDVLFLVFSDLSFRGGSLYHAVGTNDIYWLSTGILMTSVLLAGLILRERRGPAAIGVESAAMLMIYTTAVVLQVFA